MKSRTVDLVNMDIRPLSAGYRASKGVGFCVLNHEKETIGEIDDGLVRLDGKQPFAVPSGATKEVREMQPEFKYAKE